jgi:hypothetical protein
MVCHPEKQTFLKLLPEINQLIAVDYRAIHHDVCRGQKCEKPGSVKYKTHLFNEMICLHY